MANPNVKTPRTQHSVWLLLGGALLVSVFGWAGIVRQTEGSVNSAAEPMNLAVVELPSAQTSERGSVAQAPIASNRATTSAPLRRVTRPVLRSRSSN